MPSSLTISLPDALRAFAEEQAAKEGLPSAGDYIRRILEEDLRRRGAKLQLEAKLLEALAEGPPREMTASDWESLREEARAQLASEGAAVAE